MPPTDPTTGLAAHTEWDQLSLLEQVGAMDALRTRIANAEGRGRPISWNELGRRLGAGGGVSRTTVEHYAKLALLPLPVREMLRDCGEVALSSLIRRLRNLPTDQDALRAHLESAIAEARIKHQAQPNTAAARAVLADKRFAARANQRSSGQVPSFAVRGLDSDKSSEQLPEGDKRNSRLEQPQGLELISIRLPGIGRIAPELLVEVRALPTKAPPPTRGEELARALERASLELEDAADRLRNELAPESSGGIEESEGQGSWA